MMNVRRLIITAVTVLLLGTTVHGWFSQFGGCTEQNRKQPATKKM